MKRFFVLLLACIAVLPLLAACKYDEVAPAPEPEDTTCYIAYDSNTVTFSNVKNMALGIQERAGVEVKVKHDLMVESQILIGHVDSPDVQQALSDLRTDDYVLGMFGKSYVITGLSRETTNRAVQYFNEHVLPTLQEGKVELAQLAVYRQNGSYELKGITINGNSPVGYTIVIPQLYSVSELRLAVALQQHLYLKCGYELPIQTAEWDVAGPCICIGASLCERATVTKKHGYTVVCNGNDLEIAFSTHLGYQAAENALIHDILSPERESCALTQEPLRGDGAALATVPLTTDGDVRILLNNMYGGHQAIHPMAPRTSMMTELYLAYSPDVLGLQEYSPSADSTGFMQNLLDAGYRYVEVGATAAGKEDRTPLLYNPATVELAASNACGYLRFNDLTYNEYPEFLVYGDKTYTATEIKSNCKDTSKGFDWAIFRVKATGEVFMVASVHLWWKTASDARNVIARKIQMQAMKDELSRQAAAFAAANGIAVGTVPIFTGGDYNCNTSSSSPLKIMDSTAYDNPFLNANSVASESLTLSTHHSYAAFEKGFDIKGILRDDPELGMYVTPQKNTNPYYNSAIDHIFLNRAAASMITVNRMGAMTDDYAYLSSDHLPIYVDVSFAPDAPRIAR